MAEAQSISSPMVSNCKLSTLGADLFSYPTLYHSVVRTLQYVTPTRPEISFPVNKVCQCMAKPLDCQWVVIKRILQYLKGSLFHGLHFQPALPVQSFVMLIGHLILMIDILLQDQPSSFNKARHRSLAQTTTKLTCISTLVTELQVSFTTPETIMGKQLYIEAVPTLDHWANDANSTLGVNPLPTLHLTDQHLGPRPKINGSTNKVGQFMSWLRELHWEVASDPDDRKPSPGSAENEYHSIALAIVKVVKYAAPTIHCGNDYGPLLTIMFFIPTTNMEFNLFFVRDKALIHHELAVEN
ncbi:hypothetical protein V8G54_015917 [Vigna mungo]|uniref:Uncharacterized protein n=1 Tax=Vigna mungo TaxID=3915 RepID=A0AAQ3RYV0_VIGMU